jgi:diadenosine tetraphosphate (Ap4A) HIT family hydrolase
MTAPPDAFALDPRLAADTHLVGEMQLSRLLLMNDARFPWLILVPRRSALSELTDLPWTEQQRLLREINTCAQVLRALPAIDKLNVAALGNVVAQLHVHVVARRSTDAAWPRPVWGVGERTTYDDAALQLLLAHMRTALPGR